MLRRPKHQERSTVSGTLATFDESKGWGVITAPETPGGRYVRYSVLRIQGYQILTPSQRARFTYDEAPSLQLAYKFRAIDVWLNT